MYWGKKICNLMNFNKIFPGGAGIWTQDFQHAKQTLYHWVTPPCTNWDKLLYSNKIYIRKREVLLKREKTVTNRNRKFTEFMSQILLNFHNLYFFLQIIVELLIPIFVHINRWNLKEFNKMGWFIWIRKKWSNNFIRCMNV